MSLREQLEERRRQWRAFQDWETRQPPAPERPPSRVLADLSLLRHWIGDAPDEDPEKLGIQKMRAALARLRTPVR